MEINDDARGLTVMEILTQLISGLWFGQKCLAVDWLIISFCKKLLQETQLADCQKTKRENITYLNIFLFCFP